MKPVHLDSVIDAAARIGWMCLGKCCGRRDLVRKLHGHVHRQERVRRTQSATDQTKEPICGPLPRS